METNTNKGDYIAPTLEILLLQVEQGFAGSQQIDSAVEEDYGEF